MRIYLQIFQQCSVSIRTGVSGGPRGLADRMRSTQPPYKCVLFVKWDKILTYNYINYHNPIDRNTTYTHQISSTIFYSQSRDFVPLLYFSKYKSYAVAWLVCNKGVFTRTSSYQIRFCSVGNPKSMVLQNVDNAVLFQILKPIFLNNIIIKFWPLHQNVWIFQSANVKGVCWHWFGSKLTNPFREWISQI